MKKTKKAPSFEELIPDAELREKMKAHLYSKKTLFGEGSIFSELLQSAVNGMLNGEMEDFLSEERAKENVNKRNGYTKKVINSLAGSSGNPNAPRSGFRFRAGVDRQARAGVIQWYG